MRRKRKIDECERVVLVRYLTCSLKLKRTAALSRKLFWSFFVVACLRLGFERCALVVVEVSVIYIYVHVCVCVCVCVCVWRQNAGGDRALKHLLIINSSTRDYEKIERFLDVVPRF